MKLKSIILSLTLATLSTAATAQRTFSDIMGRKLIGIGYAWENKLDKFGKPKMYAQKTPMTWTFKSDGTMLWSENGDKTYHYTRNDSIVNLTADYQLKFFVDWPFKRDNSSYEAYITARSNDGVLHYFTLSPSDLYALYEKALSENRLYAAYDYMFLLSKRGDCFADCALAFLEETIDDFPGDGDGTIRYLSVDYYIKKTPEDLAQSSQQMMQGLADAGLIPQEATTIADDNTQPFFTPNDAQKKLLQAFARQRLGVTDMLYPFENEEEHIANISSGVKNFQKAIDVNDDATSNFYMGKICYEGLLGFKEKARGLKFIEKAVAKGSALACCYLGNIKLSEGDTASARKLWQQAANAKLQKIEIRTTTLETLSSPNPDMPEVRQAVKEAKENLTKNTK